MNNQKGQALLFVILALTIALALAINVSVRTLSSLSRVSKVDTASRALAAAEGGIESFLSLKPIVLSQSVSDKSCPLGSTQCDSQNCAGFDISDTSKLYCRLTYADPKANVNSMAVVSVSEYKPKNYPFELQNGRTREINLEPISGDVDLCWSPLGDNNVDLYYLIYAFSGVTSRGFLQSSSSLNYASGYQTGERTDTSSGSSKGYPEYASCYTIPYDAVQAGVGLRVRPIGGDAKIFVHNDTGLPIQGYEFVSVGSIERNSDILATREIKTIITLPFAISGIDHAVYTNGSISQ